MGILGRFWWSRMYFCAALGNFSCFFPFSPICKAWWSLPWTQFTRRPESTHNYRTIFNKNNLLVVGSTKVIFLVQLAWRTLGCVLFLVNSCMTWEFTRVYGLHFISLSIDLFCFLFFLIIQCGSMIIIIYIICLHDLYTLKIAFNLGKFHLNVYLRSWVAWGALFTYLVLFIYWPVHSSPKMYLISKWNRSKCVRQVPQTHPTLWISKFS